MGYGRIEYLSALETYQTKENSEPYYRFMLTALNRSLKMMIDLLDVEKAEPQGKLLTIAKFAKLAGLPVSTIRYWMKEGKIKPITYTVSGYVMFDENQIAEIKKD